MNFFSGLTHTLDSNEHKAFNELQGLLCKDYISELQDKYTDQYQLIISQIQQDVQKDKIPNAVAATC